MAIVKGAKRTLALEDPKTMFRCYVFHSTGIVVEGRPTFEEHQNAGAFIQWTAKGSPWWLADWMAYGESREDWRERLSQAHHVSGLQLSTLQNMRSVARAIPAENRVPEVEFTLHEVVASLPAAEQREWLEQARDEGLKRSELRSRVRRAKRQRVLEGCAVLEGQFRVWYIDPPWPYENSQPSGSNAADKYGADTMSYEELAKMPFAAHATKEGVAFIWVTAPILYDNPGPRDVIEAWGWTYKQHIIWDKVRGAGGNYTRGNHELLLICTRGDCVPDVQKDLPDSVQVIEKNDHSEKPEEFREIIVKHYTYGPYAEGFARRAVDGWACFGSDLGVTLR